MEKPGSLRVADVCARLGVARGTAYAVIRELNAELEAKGYRTVRGRVSEGYFDRRYFGGNEVERGDECDGC